LSSLEPAGELEEFFVEFSKLISEGHPDSGEVAELFARYDIDGSRTVTESRG
jgi:hypothetical protein